MILRGMISRGTILREMISCSMISRSLGTRCQRCRAGPAGTTFVAKLHPHQKRTLLAFRWIQHGLGFIPRAASRINTRTNLRTIFRTTAAAQSGVLSKQASSLHPSVPDAELAAAAST